MKLFVGNLSYQTTQQDLLSLFFEYGTVESVNVITDRDTGQPRGFAFIEMPNGAEAEAAIKALDGREVGGRNMNVSEARPKPEGGGGGGFKKGPAGGGGGGRNRRY